MTTASERTRALRFAEELMRDLLDVEKYPDLPEGLRREARVVLRHYPDEATREAMIRACEHGVAASMFGPILAKEEK